MLCRVCNTRIRPGGTACPNCGSHSKVRPPTAKTRDTSKLPPQPTAAEPPDEEAPSLSKAKSKRGSERKESNDATDVDVTLDVPTEVELNEPAEVGASAPEIDVNVDPEEKEDAIPEAGGDGVTHRGPAGDLDAAGLKALLADQPGLLEPGLTIHANDMGERLGVGYGSAVGEIDLLARDVDGGFVVVVIADGADCEQLVSDVLQRIGWVRKHLSAGDERVRGIVLLDGEQQEVGYAAAAVAGTVGFKSYRISVQFEDMEF